VKVSLRNLIKVTESLEKGEGDKGRKGGKIDFKWWIRNPYKLVTGDKG